MRRLHHSTQVKPKKFKKPTTKPISYPEEVITELRGVSLNFLKLDLAYLATILAVIGALKLHQSDIFDYLSSARYFIAIFSLLCAADVVVFICLLQDWIHIKTMKSRESGNQRAAKYTAHWQPLLHLLFLTGTLAFVTGFASGGTDRREGYRAFVQIQDALDRYIDKNKKLPTEPAQIIDGEPTKKAIEKFGIERIKIERSSKDVYLLTAEPGIIGTAPYTITASIKASEILKEMEKEERSK